LARGSALGSAGAFSSGGGADRHVVEKELERILASPLFRNSRRYPAFLRHIVEQTLAGQGALLKERSIGIDLFERSPDYDTNTDHIVRTTAAEIRKRIAQYYRESGCESPIRIELPPGSYVPEFRVQDSGAGVAAEPLAIAPAKPHRWRIDKRIAIVTGVGVILGGLIALALWHRLERAETASVSFWAPVLNSSGAVTICVSPPVASGSPLLAATPNLPNFLQLHNSETEHISVGDAEALARLAAFLGSEHKSFQIRRSPISLADLRQGPVVLIGGFNNEWTIRLTGELRFRFEGSPEGVAQLYWIGDRLNPGSRDWSFDFGKPASSSTQDYALISRVFDSTTGRQLITAAGIAKYGTAAAGEFLTNPNLLAEFARRAPKGWTERNVQIVIRTKVISDNSGPPELVAVAVW
jgi:hypothetical protein